MRAIKYTTSVRAPLRNKNSVIVENSPGDRDDFNQERVPVSGRFLERLARGCLYLFIFLVPLFFLPFTSDFIEFNKQYLLYTLIGIACLAGAARGFMEHGFRIPRTPFDLPLQGFFAAVLISSIFSKDRAASFFGEYDRLTFGVVPLLWYLLFFYLLVHHIRTVSQIRRVFTLMATGATLAGLYFWAAVFGLTRAPALAAFLPAWNVASGVNSRFAILLVIPLLIALTFLLDSQSSRGKKVWWVAQALIAFVTIVMFGFKGVFLVAAVMLAIWLAVIFTRLQGVRLPVVSLAMVAFLLLVVLSVFGTGGLLGVRSLPAEVSLAQGASWNIALSTLKEGVGRALIGTGPATFGYDFSAHRPQTFNQNPFWSIRFGSASSEAASLTATIGAIGILLLIFLLLTVLRLFKVVSVRQAPSAVEERIFLGGTMGIWVAMCAAFLLIPFSTVYWVYFFAFLALFVAQGRLRMPEEVSEVRISLQGSPSSSLISSFGGVMLLAVLFILGVYLGRFYAGEVYFRQGLRASARQDMEQAAIALSRAVTINNEQARYLLAFTQVQFQQAVKESQKSEPDISRAGGFISSAVAAARRATERAPHSAAAWEQLGGLYGQVVALAPDARGWAIAAYERAIDLEPTNPLLLVLRGQQFLADKKFEEATRDFEMALELKPDYALAYLALSSLHEGQNNLDLAISSTERAVQLARNDISVAYQLARLYVNRNQGEDASRAQRILAAIISRNADHANAHFTLGTLYERQGKTGEALREFEKVRELNPNNEEVRRKLEGLIAPPPQE